MEFKHNKGGRPTAVTAPDCVTRALTILTGATYATVAAYLAPQMTEGGVDIFAPEFTAVAESCGLRYLPVSQIGAKVHELPTEGRFMAHTKGHVSAIVDGVVQDTFDTRGEILRGYWLPISKTGYNVYRGSKKLNISALKLEDAARMVSLYILNYSRGELVTVRPNI